ncbi:MAG: hypothetical protein J7L51_02315, partial [Desulfurococcales archaeon]|nr:hypothetical protein [Desulfurococcales archaeon]
MRGNALKGRKWFELFTEFAEKWFRGHLGATFREVGYAVGPLKHPDTRFRRDTYHIDGFKLLLNETIKKNYREINLYTSVAMYEDLDMTGQRFDRIYYDFDSKED